MQQIAHDPRILRIPDLARLLNCTELAARRMVERGEVPSRKWGRRVVILVDDLKTHLKGLPVREGER